MIRCIHCRAMAAILLAAKLGAGAAPTSYTNETEYIQALVAGGYVWSVEGFEDDAVWGEARSTVVGGTFTQPSVTNLAIRWQANNDTSRITTSQGPARSGWWGLYSLPHGNYATGDGCGIPGNCGDGIIGTSVQLMHGIATWAVGTFGGKLDVILDGDGANPVDFPEVCGPSGEDCVAYGLLGTGHKFFGVIEPAGFTRFEFREVEGTAEDQKLVWFDDFTVAFQSAPPSRITSISVSSNQVELAITGLAIGAHYTLERTPSLDSNAWSQVATFTASAPETYTADIFSPGSHQAFYRLRSP